MRDREVAYWPLADISTIPTEVRFWGGLCCKTSLLFAAGVVSSIRQLAAFSADSV